MRYNFAADSFYIMKLCSRLFVLYCQNCPKDDKFRYFMPISGRPFVKRFALCYRPVVLSVCPVLSVCDVGVLWPNGWTDQDENWQAGRPRPWPHCVRWGPIYPIPKGARTPPSIFGPYLLRPNGCMDQDGMELGLGPGDFVLVR